MHVDTVAASDVIASSCAPAASYWLRRVLDDGGRRDWDESIVQGVSGAEPAIRTALCSKTSERYFWLGQTEFTRSRYYSR